MPPVNDCGDVILLQCYNKGCQQKFDPTENNNEACCYHPGPPYFHDAYKIWNCCNKKSTDFTTWLEFPGCTKGKHNPEKPADLVRVAAVQDIRPEKEDEVIVWNGLNKPAERLKEGERVEVDIQVEIAENAKAAIDRHLAHQGNRENDLELKIGAPCCNSGCEAVYNGVESDNGVCVYHPGQAIFHEGMKYWSCCEKKTSNFNAFLEQKGCSKGVHQWRKNEVISHVREDHFASAGSITINVYCKNTLPETFKASTDGQMLRVNLQHSFGTKETELLYDLWGRIIPEESRVVIGERKVELILKQRDAVSWPRLRYEGIRDAEIPDDTSTDSKA